MVNSPAKSSYSCKTKSEMSEKGRFPKNVVQTRAKGKSKDSGDTNSTKPKTQTQTNYETDEPLANDRANRTLGRDYSSDVPVGGPQSGPEVTSASVAAQAERLHQLTPAVRSLEQEFQAVAATPQPTGPDPVLVSDAESMKSTRRPSSRASQSETVKRKKVKRNVDTSNERRAPEGLTEEETGAESSAVQDQGRSGPAVTSQSAQQPSDMAVRPARDASQEDDLRSVRSNVSGTSRRSARSRCSVTSSLEDEVRRELDIFRHQVMSAYTRRGFGRPQCEEETRRMTEDLRTDWEEGCSRRQTQRRQPQRKLKKSDTDYQTDKQVESDRRQAERLQAELDAEVAAIRARPHRSAPGRQRQGGSQQGRQGAPRPSSQQARPNGARQAGQLLVAAGAGAPGGDDDDDDDDADSDRDWYRRHRNRHVRDAARRRAARMSDNPDNQYPPSRTGRTASPAPSVGSTVQQPGLIQPRFDAGKIAADAVAVASAALQALAPTRMQLEHVNLPTFDGKDFLLFHKQFEAVISEQKWSPETCARKLLECLEGDTRRHVEVYMTYDEMLEALRQYYAGSRPSVEAKNILRQYTKNKDETIEAFATRIQAFADGARLTPFDKMKYMQEAFMNGIKHDTKMQRYIEKRTSQNENVHIVKLLKAAQDYLHDKQGSTQTGQPTKAKLNKHKTKSKGGDGQQEVQPQCNAMSGNRKEPLTHEDAEVEQEVEQEQAKVQKDKSDRKQSNNNSWKKRLEVSQKTNEELQAQLKQAIEAMAQRPPPANNGNFQGRNPNYRGNNGNGGNWNNNNNWNGQGQRNGGGFGNNQRYNGPRNDGYRSDSSRSQWRNGPNYTDTRVFNNSNYPQGNAQPPRQDFNNRPPPSRDQPPPQQARPAPPTSAAAPQAAPPACNRHETPSQTDRLGGIDPSVFPEDGRYSGSSGGSQA